MISPISDVKTPEIPRDCLSVAVACEERNRVGYS